MGGTLARLRTGSLHSALDAVTWLAMPMSKTIFVTGAASGIGKATSLLFGAKGWRVGCYDVDVDGARRVAEQLPQLRLIEGAVELTRELPNFTYALARRSLSQGLADRKPG